MADPITLTDARGRTVHRVLIRDSTRNWWLRVRGIKHAFSKRKWYEVVEAW